MHANDYFRSEIRADESDLKRYETALKTIPHLNSMKNNSLYAGLVEDVFQEPREVVSEEAARELINITRERLGYIQVGESASVGKIAGSKVGKKMRRLAK